MNSNRKNKTEGQTKSWRLSCRFDTYSDPRVLESLTSGKTLGQVESQEAIDEVLGAVADATPVLGWIGVVTRLGLDVHLLLVVTVERREATKPERASW